MTRHVSVPLGWEAGVSAQTQIWGMLGGLGEDWGLNCACNTVDEMLVLCLSSSGAMCTIDRWCGSWFWVGCPCLQGYPSCILPLTCRIICVH
jgi:hypothetical protein